MKVLHLISSGGMYGAEAVILNLSGGLRSLGNESSIVSFANASDQLHQKAREKGFSSALLPCKGQLDMACIRRIRSMVAEANVDVVHAHGYKADLYVWAALRETGRALVSTCHTWYDNDFAVRLYGALDRFVLRRFDGVVAVSKEVQARLLKSGVLPSRIREIRNGIDLEPFGAIAATRFETVDRRFMTVGLVGRLSHEKGVDVFIDAAGQLASANPTFRFVVFGDGPERANLQRQAERVGLQDRLLLAGRREDMPEAYAGLDLLVSASRQEGLPIALLEGMASGLPVVATRVGEIPAVVRNGESGFLVRPGDPKALSEAIRNVLESGELRLRFGRSAREHIARVFSADTMTREYLALYEHVLQQGRCA